MSLPFGSNRFFQCIDPWAGKIMCEIARRVNPFRPTPVLQVHLGLCLFRLHISPETLVQRAFSLNGFSLVFDLGCH